MSDLLIDESPVLVIPSLAVKIGLNEAMVLQQIHYWAKKKKTAREGFYWVYNSYEAWQEQFPFFSKSTIGRTIRSLEKLDLLITGNFNKLSFDKTKWYRINYNKLDEYKDKDGEKGFKTPLNQDESSNVSNWNDDGVKLTSSVVSERTNNTLDYPKTTTKNNIKDIVELEKTAPNIDHAPLNKNDEMIKEIIEYLNHVTNSKYRYKTASTKKMLNARINEGYTLADFKRVIDVKSSQWLNSDMEKFLRPSTLFNASKFDNYANEKPLKARRNDFKSKRQNDSQKPLKDLTSENERLKPILDYTAIVDAETFHRVLKVFKEKYPNGEGLPEEVKAIEGNERFSKEERQLPKYMQLDFESGKKESRWIVDILTGIEVKI